MKALVMKDQLELCDVPIPQPFPGYARIKVSYAGICASDLHIIKGDIKLNTRPNTILGHEFSGVVDAVGCEDDEWLLGKNVSSETTFHSCGTCCECVSSNYNLCKDKQLIGYYHDGCFAEYVVVPSNRVHVLSDDLLSAVMLEPLACAAHATMEKVKINPSDTVVLAGLGTIGVLSAQILKQNHPILIGTKESLPRCDLAAKIMNCDVYLNSDEKTVLATSECDFYIECSGSEESVSFGLNALRRGGTFLQIGILTKPVNIEKIVYKEINMVGSLGSKRSSWLRAIKLLPNLQIRPLLNGPFKIEDYKEAFNNAENGIGIKTYFSFCYPTV